MAAKFQRRHHEALAKAIRNHQPASFIGASVSKSKTICNSTADLTTTIADMLEEDNSNFNREKFIRRCGWH